MQDKKSILEFTKGQELFSIRASMMQQSNQTVLMISLGGTLLSTAIDPITQPFYQSPSLDINQILAYLPELADITRIQTESLCNVISHELTHEMLFNLAKRVQLAIEDPDLSGIVISQGTNALEEVAYFLNLVIKTDKPIVCTGAMKPANALGFDGIRNLYNAVILAASPESRGKGVLITFNDTIVSARDAAKTSATLSSDFSANHFGLLGYIQSNKPHFYRVPSKRHTTHSEFIISEIDEFPVIYILYGHLGVDPALIAAMINLGARGIISVGMGGGYQPSPATKALAKAVAAGITVIRCTTMSQGIVHWDEQTDGKYGFIPGDSLTPQKARILLGVALHKTTDKHELRRIFSEY